MTAIPVTDADRELLTRMMTGKPHTEHDWPVVWEQDALQSIARARAEGAASERAECDEAVQSVDTPAEWADKAETTRERHAFWAGLIAASDAIRARGEQGGK